MKEIVNKGVQTERKKRRSGTSIINVFLLHLVILTSEFISGWSEAKWKWSRHKHKLRADSASSVQPSTATVTLTRGLNNDGNCPTNGMMAYSRNGSRCILFDMSYLVAVQPFQMLNWQLNVFLYSQWSALRWSPQRSTTILFSFHS